MFPNEPCLMVSTVYDGSVWVLVWVLVFNIGLECQALSSWLVNSIMTHKLFFLYLFCFPTRMSLLASFLSLQISRLIYTNSGNAILALASNAIHLLWKWQRSDRNASGKVRSTCIVDSSIMCSSILLKFL